MFRRFALALAMILTAFPALAVPEEDADALFDALGLAEIIRVMRVEGMDYGADLQEQMFPGRGGPSWSATVDGIYDAEEMAVTVKAAFVESLSEDEVGPLLDFFTSDRGARIIRYEVSAREAMVDADIEAAAAEALARMRAERSDRLDLIEAFVEVNDLVSSNVTGAMNSNYAFYLGLADGDAFPGTMTERDMLNDVWAQEPEIRADTETWVYSYLAMAYQPLSDEDLEVYIALSRSPAGRALNRALFSGFDEMFERISRSLGMAAARFMTGEDI